NFNFHSKGTKPGKHARDSSGGGDGSQDSPLPKRSPKSASSKREVGPSVEGGVGEDSEHSSSEKENISEMSEDISKTSGESKSKSSKSKIPEQSQPEEEMISSQQSPVKMEPRELEPLTPLVINDNQDVSISQHKPQATSTPAANGQIRSPPLSPDSGTDQSDDEAFSPSDQQLPSPSASINSSSTTSSRRNQADSLDSRRSEPNFGRFYNTSYLGMGKQTYTKGATVTPKDKQKATSGSHFHRPPNFTYSKEPPDFLKKK
ncbi:unnamed protein product, partial [Lymnaea stagnalis]